MGIILKTIGADFSSANLGVIGLGTYTITVVSENTNYGTVTGGGTFNYGASITITATARSGYVFSHWSDGNTNASRQISVTESRVYTAVFIVVAIDKCYSPTCSPSAGTYTSAQSVTLSTATSGATIHYTTDGSTPTENSPVYYSAISISNTTTIRAIATKSGMTTSSVSTFAFIISSQPVTETMTINTPTSTDGTTQLSVAVSSGYVPTNLTWSITSGSEYATINSSTGLLTMNWSDTAHNVTVHVKDNVGGLTADKTLSVTKVWHPTTLNSASGFVVFHSSYMGSKAGDGPIVAPFASNNNGIGSKYRDRRAIWVLPKTLAPADTLSATTISSNGTQISDYISDVDKNAAANYVRILIPKGCKTITFKHTNTSYNLSMFLGDDYQENNGSSIIDIGWAEANTLYTFDVSNYNGGINGSKKYYLTPNARVYGNSDGIIADGQPVIETSGVEITFNY